MSENKEIKTKKVISLFSGCGGMDLGFEGDFTVLKKSINLPLHSDWIEREINDKIVLLKPNSFRIIMANDIEKNAQTAWCTYFTKFGYNRTIYKLDSIVDMVLNGQLNQPEYINNVDIITGGFPCQDFSLAGKRLGFLSHKNDKGMIKKTLNEESRGNLYLWMKKAVEIIKPKMFIAENVKGLTTLKDVKDIIVNDFSEAAGNSYLVVEPKVLLCANYGIPQSRERIFFIGFLKSALTKNALAALSETKISEKYDPYPIITHYNGNNPKDSIDKFTTYSNFVTSGEALSGLKEPNLTSDESQKVYSKARFLSNKSQGQIEIDLNDIAPTIRSEHHGNIEYRRLSEINGGKYIHELAEGKIERRLTVRECARLQTFPDDFKFVFRSIYGTVSASSAYKLIGNAVPPLMAYNIAKRIESNWKLYFGQ